MNSVKNICRRHPERSSYCYYTRPDLNLNRIEVEGRALSQEVREKVNFISYMEEDKGISSLLIGKALKTSIGMDCVDRSKKVMLIKGAPKMVTA